MALRPAQRMALLFVGLVIVTTIALSLVRSRGPSQAAWIVFEREVAGNWEVYRVDISGRGLRRLTTHPATDWHPEWSPDGRWIVFVSDRAGHLSLYRMQPAGQAVEAVPNYQGADPNLSPDGRWVIVTLRGSQFYLAQPGNRADLIPLTDYPGNDRAPRWSPDSQWLVLQSDRDGNAEIYRMRYDGTRQQRLTHFPGEDWNPVWSADGRWIVFVSDRAGNQDLYRMRPDGSTVQPLTRYPGRDQWPSVSPPVDLRWRGARLLLTAGVLVTVGWWARRR